jgi:hypothetical protein
MTLRTHTRRRGRRLSAAVVSLLVLAGLLAAAVVPATGAPGDELLPDLVSEPVGAPAQVAEQDTVGDETRLLLRFTGFIRNEGAGPLEVTGVNSEDGMITGSDVKQVITHNHDTDGIPGLDRVEEVRPGSELKFENTDLHNHWHFQKAASYTLWDEDQESQVEASSKVGFCFLDIDAGDEHWLPGDAGFPVPEGFGVAPRAFYHAQDPVADPAHAGQPCLNGQPELGATDKVDMGISRGWRDVYERTLPLQYIDVSNTRPGRYYVGSEVNPEQPNGTHLLRESDYSNNGTVFADQASIVPGYVAKPVDATLDSGKAEITLDKTSFGTGLTPVEYKIVSQPDDGQVKVNNPNAQGWFSDPHVTYTRTGGDEGDSFKYVARQTGPAGQFPESPIQASASIGRAVAISGASASLFTGQSMTLTTNRGPVAWKVNGVTGGSPATGTITSGGVYTAPASVPAGGKVSITARADDGGSDTVSVTIKARPVTPPSSPGLPNPPVPPVKPAPALSKPLVARNGRRLVVKYMPGRTGRLTVNVSYKGKRVARCRTQVVSGRGTTCRFFLKKAKVKRLKGRLTVGARLTSGKRTLAIRRVTVSLRVTSKTARIGPLCILTP